MMTVSNMFLSGINLIKFMINHGTKFWKNINLVWYFRPMGFLLVGLVSALCVCGRPHVKKVEFIIPLLMF